MAKKYVLISNGYSDKLAVPVGLLEKLLEEGYLVSTSWDTESSQDRVSSVKPIQKVEVIDFDEIRTVLAAQVLAGGQ